MLMERHSAEFSNLVSYQRLVELMQGVLINKNTRCDFIQARFQVIAPPVAYRKIRFSVPGIKHPKTDLESHFVGKNSKLSPMNQETRANQEATGDPMKITAILGTYRKNGVIDAAVDEILASAREAGADTEKIYLIDRHIEFCTNCRACTQQQGDRRGPCPLIDDMNGLLDNIEHADAFVLASPMNFWTVTAVMKRFIERLVCYAYWPWGKHTPKTRNVPKTKRAVVVVSSACPALLARLMTRMVGLLKTCARLLGAKTVDVLFIGSAAGEVKADIGVCARKKARRLGKKLAS